MARQRSFTSYVADRYYNELFAAINDYYAETNSDNLIREDQTFTISAEKAAIQSVINRDLGELVKKRPVLINM